MLEHGGVCRHSGGVNLCHSCKDCRH
jgi:hypothetical protein